METCVRGFSFMTESNTDMQYIEGGELERAWRSTRRERMKQREQRIWDNFVKEQDAVKGICNDDPYQFLDPLPDSCMKEIMDTEQQKVTQENAEEETKVKSHGKGDRIADRRQQGAAQRLREDTEKSLMERPQHGTGDNSSAEEEQHTCVVTFAEDMDKENCDMFHIFDDEQSGGEDEALNDSNTPDTVREVPTETASREHSPDRDIDLKKTSSKSSENAATVIESSIYCARVKELRAKINEELLALMTSLDRRDILLSSEPEDITRMVKRSADFCNRFNRIYMYQLQRQIHDIKRNNNQSLPFAKHTQFQAQMTRIVSLHQNLLQSFMVFHKSFSQTCCVRESAGALGSLLAAVRDSTHMCLNVPPPRDFVACLDLYKDDLLTTCDKVDEFVNEYAIRCEEFLNRFENVVSNTSSKKGKKDNKVKKRSWNNRSSIKTSTESQLSMYSTDTVRLNLNARSNTSSKDNQPGSSSKMRIASGANIYLKRSLANKNPDPPKSTRRSRRPLMRDPHAGRPRAPKISQEIDIKTMVEAVETCASSHISGEDSPNVRLSKRSTPRRAHPSSARAPPAPAHPSPRAPPAHHTNTPQPSPRAQTKNETTHKNNQSSARRPKPSEEPSSSKTKPRPLTPKSTAALKDSLSLTKNETEAEEAQMMPVLTIKCAMKKDLNVEDIKHDPSRVELSPKALSPKGVEDTKVKVTSAGSLLKVVYKHGECNKPDASPRKTRPNANREVPEERTQTSGSSPDDRFDVPRLLKQLCSGDGSGGKSDRVTGAKNAQLLYISGSSPRQPSTPQLLRILEETIKKKIPKPLFQGTAPARGSDRYRLQFNIDEKTADTLFQYRTKYVQHMLTSSMYANSAVGKPWEMIGNISEQIIDDVLLGCVKQMELRNMILELYKKETSC